MTREEKIAEAAELRNGGSTYQQIADRIGISVTTAYRWVNPGADDRSRKAALNWKRRNRAHVRAYNRRRIVEKRRECDRCGGPLYYEATSGICVACRKDARDRRGRQIESLWAEGLTRREIATRLDLDVNQLGVEIAKFRKDGYDLPRRVNWDPIYNTRLPDRSAA